jgi:hypothetical protein
MVNTLKYVSDGLRSFVSEEKRAIMVIIYLGQFLNISESESNIIVEN